jgi:hypothetical protein
MPAHTAPAAVIVLDGTSADAGAIFRTQPDGGVRFDVPIRGAGHLIHAARIVARALGLAGGAAIEALAELAGASDPQEWGGAFDKVLRPDANGHGAVALDEPGLRAVLDRAAAESPGALTTIDHPHREVQRRRRAIAAGLVERQLQIVAQIASTAAPGRTAIGFGGSFFVSPRVNTRLATALGAPGRVVTFSPVPEPVGLALGAALAIRSTSHPAAPPLRSLAFGPAFGEDEIKETLENCRIDYVYEPDWPRLTTRASQLLGRGKVIAWFHGPLDFGPRSLGGRSILCDPSNRYARHNINEYLLRRPLDAPLAVSLPIESANESLDAPVASPFMLLRARFREDRAESFQAALDPTRACAVHTVDRAIAPELHDLLTTHAAATGVPGLIHCPLHTNGAPTAATPRDAIGSLFTSAIDAIVISRFLVMKDYWLLRTAAV